MSIDFSDMNCSYTTSGGDKIKLSMQALLEVVQQIPERPKIFAMKIDVLRYSILPENYIMLSDSVANALEAAIEKARRKNELT